MKYLKIAFFTCLIFISCSLGNNFDQDVKRAVIRQMEQYPLSGLQDLYKNFFQDRFGPGHMIVDSLSARKYLDFELASFDTSAGIEIEATGYEHNFYRINLIVLKKQKIPYDVFINAFIESANTVKALSNYEWIKEWTAIEKIIASMDLQLHNYDVAKLKIDSLLAVGKFAIHHSPVYEQVYFPHYRIISRKIFERDLKKYFE